MAQYFTDFSEYAAAEGAPSGWTDRGSSTLPWSIVADGGNKYMQIGNSQTGNENRAISWDDVPSVADVKLFCRIRVLNFGTNFNGNFGALFCRGSGNLTAYTFVLRGESTAQSGTTNGIWRASTTTVAAVANDGPNWLADTWYDVEVEASGSALRMQRWATGDSRPEGWSIDATHSTITAAGWLGLYSRRAATTQWAAFGVGTDGDPAPTGPVGGARRRSPLLLTPW